MSTFDHHDVQCDYHELENGESLVHVSNIEIHMEIYEGTYGNVVANNLTRRVM